MAKQTVLIVSVVRRGWGDRILEASIKAGAGGGTILFARGAGMHETQKIMGIAVEPEKEVLLTVTSRHLADEVLDAITKAGELDKPGTGMAFTIAVEKLAGVIHLLSGEEEHHKV